MAVLLSAEVVSRAAPSSAARPHHHGDRPCVDCVDCEKRGEDRGFAIALRAAAAAVCPGCNEGRAVVLRPLGVRPSGWWHLTHAEPRVPHFNCYFSAARLALDPTGELLTPTPGGAA